MKGLLVKNKDKISKAGIPQNGVGLVANITWHSGASWSVGGLRVSDEMHLVWDGGMLEVGDVIEVEVAEFDEASAPVWEEKHCCPTRTASNDTDNPKEWEHKLDLYYRLKKVLEDENLI